ncbi:hypothetical protein RRG08_026897 [Elysia crispata]|uniref:Uncharacterized protein n=1 Tax=Elysia crispata TaxID=231223 RepID=A0AAE1AD75_9GAST|nr:hypothetical protein RRG08_026897 [Elysia crispata]
MTDSAVPGNTPWVPLHIHAWQPVALADRISFRTPRLLCTSSTSVNYLKKNPIEAALNWSQCRTSSTHRHRERCCPDRRIPNEIRERSA